MDVEPISEILQKYEALEAELDLRLEQIKADEEKLKEMEAQRANESPADQEEKEMISNKEEVLLRNANLLKSLDIAKARLRCRTLFSPIEPILEKAIQDYIKDLGISEDLSSELQQMKINDDEPSTPENTKDKNGGSKREDGEQEK